MQPLDVTRRAGLIFLSYRFSQGAIGTQNRLLLLLEERWAPTLFAREDLPAVRREVRRRVGSYFLNDRLHPAIALPWTNGKAGPASKTEAVVTNELAALFRRFEHREELVPASPDPVALAGSIVFMDDGYLRRSQGRNSNSIELRIIRESRASDPWHSVFVAHALLDRPTGSREYDLLFGLLGSEEVLEALPTVDRRILSRVIDRYNERQDLRPAHRVRLMGTLEALV
ncbi:hypothetical protein DSM112329_00195 [Paraconexibacter sp. AEG42_29]|uniref:Uncharacterized protein n=1 Tax=Paraconexibacter sp. AEG42_29 TaxID=2997339 RepID=A0AAU7AP02_9ACTN